MTKPRVAELVSVAIGAVGLAVVIGWIAGVEELESVVPGAVTMKFSTAVSFAFSGLALFSLSRLRDQKYSFLPQVALPASILVVLLFMTAHIASAVLAAPSGIDNLFIAEEEGAVQTPVPGRPSYGTIASFMIIVASGFLAMSGAGRPHGATFWLGIAVTVIGGVAAIGYAAGVPLLYYSVEGVSTAMAIHTSVLFVAAGMTLAIMARKGASANPDDRSSHLSIRTKLVSLFIITSLVPIVFVGGIALNSAKIFSPQALAGSINILGIATTVSVAMFAVVISRSFSRPILALQQATNAITRGEYRQIQVAGNDEIGLLARDFDRMVQAVEETNLNLEKLVRTRTLELEQANELLKTQDRMMRDFINVAAHELRTPITPILMIADLVNVNGENVTMTREDYDILIRNIKRLKNLAEDILDVARIESGNLQLEMEQFDLQELVSTVVEDAQKTLQAGRKSLRLQFECEKITIEADRNRMAQVISNLLSNATKFTDEGTVSVRGGMVDGALVEISVRDTGMGIDPGILQRLFGKFVSKSEKGTGLGLFISKSIVEAHGGKIRGENNKGGKGATFTVTLPAKPRASPRN